MSASRSPDPPTMVRCPAPRSAARTGCGSTGDRRNGLCTNPRRTRPRRSPFPRSPELAHFAAISQRSNGRRAAAQDASARPPAGPMSGRRVAIAAGRRPRWQQEGRPAIQLAQRRMSAREGHHLGHLVRREQIVLVEHEGVCSAGSSGRAVATPAHEADEGDGTGSGQPQRPGSVTMNSRCRRRRRCPWPARR